MAEPETKSPPTVAMWCDDFGTYRIDEMEAPKLREVVAYLAGEVERLREDQRHRWRNLFRR